MADNIAKKETTLSKTNKNIHVQEIKTLLRRKALQNYNIRPLRTSKINRRMQEEWTVNKHKPRKEAVATFRLKTDHDCLAAYLCKIGIFTYRKLDAEQQQAADLAKLYWVARFQVN